MVNGVRRVIIDVITNKPLRAFAHIPITISTKVEGWLLEAWFRQDASLKAEDLIQRMPYTSTDNVYADRKLINRLVRRRELFRDSGRCLSWTKDTYTKTWDLNLLEEIKTNPDPADPNSTRHLQDLTVGETTAVKDTIYISGNHLKKAGGRQLEGEKKAQKLQKIADRKVDREATLARMALNKNNTGNTDAEQRQVKRKETEPTAAETVSENTAEQLQQNAYLPVERYRPVTMSYTNIQNDQIGVRSGLYGEESRVNDPTEYPAYHDSGADPQEGYYSARHSMDGTAPRAPQGQGAPILRQANMLTPAHISANLHNHQAIPGYDHGVLQSYQRRNGQNPQDDFSAVRCLASRTAISTFGMPHGRPQPSNLNFAGRMNDNPMNQDLYRSGNGDSLQFQSVREHPYLSQEWRFADM